MNTENQQSEIAVLNQRWVTKDGAHWWLRSTGWSSPTETYQRNCYLDVGGTPYGAVDENGHWLKPADADSITFKDDACNYFSHSYYCQLHDVSLKPKAGSPAACSCKEVVHQGHYSPGELIKCQKCLDVYKSLQTNSCPPGTKIFSPRTREDWETFLASAQMLRDPHFIVDITRTTDGCGGCTENVMNSGEPAQATWHTSDESSWWLRDSTYQQPNGDYEANCYMDLTGTWETSSAITFDDDACRVHSRSYYCQPVKTTTTTTPPPVADSFIWISEGDGGPTPDCTCTAGGECGSEECKWGRYCEDMGTEFELVADWEACMTNCHADADCNSFTYSDGTCEGGEKKCFRSQGACASFKLTACTDGHFVTAKKPQTE